MPHFTPIPNSSPVEAAVFNDRYQEVSDDLDELINGGLSLQGFNLGAATILTIAGGSVTKIYPRHLIDTEGGAAEDDLTTIIVGVEGDVIQISCVSSARVVVVKHNTGNIWLASQVDLRLDDTNKTLRLTYNGSKWAEENTLASRAVTVATGVRVPDGGLAIQSQGWAEQRWGGHASNTLMQPDGTAAPTVTGTPTASNDTDSTYVNYATGAVATNPSGIYSPSFNYVRRQHNPKFWWLMRTGAAAANADITAVRMWLGLFSLLPTTVSTLAGATEAAAIRYDTVAGDTSFMPVCKDATTQSVGAGLIAVASGTKYLFSIEIDDANGRVLFAVNNGSPVIMTSNLPAAATELGFAFQIFTTAAAAKNFKLSRYFCRAN